MPLPPCEVVIDTECDPGPCLTRTPSLAGQANEKWPLQCSVKSRTANFGEVRPGHLGWALKDAEEFVRHEGSAAKAELGVSSELVHSASK